MGVSIISIAPAGLFDGSCTEYCNVDAQSGTKQIAG
jgi:hypothetical protein